MMMVTMTTMMMTIVVVEDGGGNCNDLKQFTKKLFVWLTSLTASPVYITITHYVIKTLIVLVPNEMINPQIEGSKPQNVNSPAPTQK